VQEYDKFLQSIPVKMRTIFEIAFITGLRYVELQRLYENPRWYHDGRNQIILPKGASRKVKQKLVQRTIDKLPATFHYIFSSFVNGRKPPESSSWNRDLARWSVKAGLEPKIGVKSSRKTIESWILKAGVPEIEVYSRQGHDPVTSLKHYQSLSFTDYELRDIKKRLSEWGII
jgi:integrase